MTKIPDAPKVISLKIQNYCPDPDTVFKDAFVMNYSSVLGSEGFLPDFDRDGLSDEYERDPQAKQRFGINLATPDTNADGFSDLVDIRMGYDVDNQFRLGLCTSGLNDYDLDALTDCEEDALGSDPLLPDTDRDGIIDGLELRIGLNPLDPADASLDFDQDGLSNLEEVKNNTSHRQTNTDYANRISIKYKSETNSTGGSECLDLIFDNIPVLQVMNGNYVRVFLYEVRTQVSGALTMEIIELQQLNFFIDRNAVSNSLVETPKDNSVRSQDVIVNLEDVI